MKHPSHILNGCACGFPEDVLASSLWHEGLDGFSRADLVDLAGLLRRQLGETLGARMWVLLTDDQRDEFTQLNECAEAGLVHPVAPVIWIKAKVPKYEKILEEEAIELARSTAAAVRQRLDVGWGAS